jgi:hypothetical protein
VEDLLFLLDAAYPFGINMTDPTFSSPDSIIDPSSLIKLIPSRGDSASHVHIKPSRPKPGNPAQEDNRAALESIVYFKNVEESRNILRSEVQVGSIQSFGHSSWRNTLFARGLKDTVEDAPDFGVGYESHIPGRYVIARVKSGLALMLKFAPVFHGVRRNRKDIKRKPKQNPDELSSPGVKTKTATELFRFSEQPLVAVEVFDEQPDGFPYAEMPDRKFGFYTIEQGAPQPKEGYGHVEKVTAREA